MAKKQTHEKMPSHLSIVAYWEDKICEDEIGIDWDDEAHKRCWRCGRCSKNRNVTQRCHIIPNSLGGLNEPENFVLLCSACHKEAPNVNDKNVMWSWLKRTSTTFYDTLPSLRAFEEYEKMYGTQFVSDVNDLFSSKFPQGTNLDYTIFFEFFGQVFAKKLTSETTIHFGEGGINPPTRAFLLREVLLTLQAKKKWVLSDERLKEIQEKNKKALQELFGRGDKKKTKKKPQKRVPMSESEFLEKHNDIVDLLKQGLDNKEIVKKTGKSISTVYKAKTFLVKC